MITIYQTDPEWSRVIKILQEGAALEKFKTVEFYAPHGIATRVVLENNDFLIWVFSDMGRIEIERKRK